MHQGRPRTSSSGQGQAKVNSSSSPRSDQRERDPLAKTKKEREKKEQLCLKISELGFWETDENVGAHLCGQSEATRKKSLETQLRFHKHVLKQSTADKSLYYLSRNKHKLSSSELHASLGKLISACPARHWRKFCILHSFWSTQRSSIVLRKMVNGGGTMDW